MNILVTNDDGWGAPGIRALKSAAKNFGQVWVVAPEQPMSGISHQLTMDRPVTLAKKTERSYSLSGTPADCARIGLTQLGIQFDCVLSGINFGGNLGADIPVSGTVAAIREASFFGCPGIAISQYLNGMQANFPWQLSSQLVQRVLTRLLAQPLKRDGWCNVNLPDTGGRSIDEIQLVETFADTHPLPAEYERLDGNQFSYAGKYQDRLADKGSDIDTCFGGAVAITRHGRSFE